MANKSDPNQWVEALSELQTNYWSAWSDLMGGGSHRAGQQASQVDGMAIWQQAADSWRNLFNMDAGEDVMDNMLSQGRAFLQMTEDVLKVGAESLDAEGMMESWTKNWQQAMGSGEGLAALWGMPQDTLRRTMSAFSVLPGDALERYKHEGVSQLVEPLREQVEKVLSIPALGYTRESQEQQQKIGREVMEFQAAMQRYMAVLASAGRDAIDLLQGKLADASEPGKGINSLRELYDLWVDASEEAFAEVALSDQHQVVYGDMVNSLMRLKRYAQGQVEHQLGVLGVPGRQELNSAHKMIHQLRREVSQLRGAVRELSAHVGAPHGKKKPTSASSPKAAKKKSASKKPVSKKAASKKPAKRASNVSRHGKGKKTSKRASKKTAAKK